MTALALVDINVSNDLDRQALAAVTGGHWGGHGHHHYYRPRYRTTYRIGAWKSLGIEEVFVGNYGHKALYEFTERFERYSTKQRKWSKYV